MRKKAPLHASFTPKVSFLRSSLASAFILLLLVQLACSITIGEPTSDSVDATLASLRTQQSALDATLQSFTAVAMQGQSTQIAKTTLDASLATASVQAQMISTLSATQGTPVPNNPKQIGERTLKSAKILLFENMSASRYVRLAKKALDEEGYFYQDVGSATGWFKDQLNSPVKWDLVIAAAEADLTFGGEFFEYINQHILDGSAAIVENWDFDHAPGGKAGLLLSTCGVSFESDWYEPQPRVFFWLQPDSTLLHFPYLIPGSMPSVQSIEYGDHGDLLRLDTKQVTGGANPQLIAGTSPQIRDSHALLVSCLGGRVILQTFKTHEYQNDVMLDLWKNYIYQALTAYFNQNGKTPPIPPVLATAPEAETPTPFAPTPGPEYIFEHGCDGLMTVRLTSSPLLQADLFEHHADGEYLILRLEIHNQAPNPVMIWDGDYAIEGKLGERAVTYAPDPDASGYLYVSGGVHLRQDVIQAGESWQVALAFDIDPALSDIQLVFRPGSEFNQTACEARLAVAR